MREWSGSAESPSLTAGSGATSLWIEMHEMDRKFRHLEIRWSLESPCARLTRPFQAVHCTRRDQQTVVRGGFAMGPRISNETGLSKGLVTVAMVLVVASWVSLANAQDKNRALIDAALQGNLPEVKKLLSEGADPNAKFEDDTTSLILASAMGHREVAGLLLEKGADVNAKDADGNTALMDAATMGHYEVVRLLIKYRANINVQDKDGVTALMDASRNGRSKVVRLLLERKADVTLKNKHGATALQEAAGEGHAEVVELLKAHGANE
jgi:hypothetical protein